LHRSLNCLEVCNAHSAHTKTLNFFCFKSLFFSKWITQKAHTHKCAPPRHCSLQFVVYVIAVWKCFHLTLVTNLCFFNFEKKVLGLFSVNFTQLYAHNHCKMKAKLSPRIDRYFDTTRENGWGENKYYICSKYNTMPHTKLMAGHWRYTP